MNKIIETKTIIEDIPFVVHSDCIPVKGARRSVICDLTRSCFIFIPNVLNDIVNKRYGNTIEEIKHFHNNQQNSVIDQYFQYLLSHEMVFFTEQPELFPPIEMCWDEPHVVLQAIIDFDNDSRHEIGKIAAELNTLHCVSLQLRFFDSIDPESLSEILSHFDESHMRSIEIILPYADNSEYDDFNKLAESHLRVDSIVVWDSPLYEWKGKYAENCAANIIYVKQKNVNENHCGAIDKFYFTINIQLFSEAQKYNTCLNRKISINTKGDIKNCPSMKQSYGNIKETTLKEAIERKNYKELWYVKKDDIEVCQDCEFRYMCTDCRAFVKNPQNVYSQPAKCHYDPYTAQWDEPSSL